MTLLYDMSNFIKRLFRRRLRGFVVMYINVGALEPLKAESHVEKIKERLAAQGLLTSLKDEGYDTIFIPTRSDSSAVECFAL